MQLYTPGALSSKMQEDHTLLELSRENHNQDFHVSFLFFGLVYYNGYFVSMWISCQHGLSIMSTYESDTKTVMLVKTM